MSILKKFFNRLNNSPLTYIEKKDKRQVITLIITILIVFSATKIYQVTAAKNTMNLSPKEEALALQRLDSLNVMYAQKIKSDTLNRLDLYIANRYDTLKLFKFNPNSASEKDLQKLGLTEKQIANLINYRKNGGIFKTENDFRKLYGLRTMQFNFLREYLCFNDSTTPQPLSKEKTEEKYFDFDPNFLTREEMYKLGFSTKQIESFMKQKDEKNWKFYVKKDFAYVYFIDEKKYKELEKYIKIDLNKLFNGKKLYDLNLANEDELSQAGFSHAEAQNIITFREKVGYFYATWQLSDCIKYDRANSLKTNVYTCHSVELKKININTADEIILLNHPYLTKFQVSKIIEARNSKQFKHIADLQTLNAFDQKDLKKLQHYIEF